jgi:type I restriction enzyme, S subunit
MAFSSTSLKELLDGKGYIRGPFGSALKRGELKDVGIPVYEQQHAISGIRDFRFYIDKQKYEELKRFTVEANDLIISCSGTVGRVSVIRENDPKGIISQALLILRPNAKKILPEFLYYFLTSPKGFYELINASHGAVQQNIAPRDVVEKILVPTPVTNEQKNIVRVLKSLDDKIELNRRMNETLEAIARALFKSWFVDFDPVRAKMSGEPPESICQRLGLTPDLLALFPDRLVDSELGEIPEGWTVGTIDDHCYLNAKSWTAKTIPEEVYYVDLANVKNGMISEVQIFSSKIAPSRARRVLRAGDTIVGTVRPGNRSFALIGEGGPALTGSTGFAVLSPKRHELRELVFFLATSDENIDRLSRLADGAAYPAVRPEVVMAGSCIVPDRSVINAFHAATESMIDYKIANRVNSDALSAVRDALLPKLLAGEVRVTC